MPLPPQLYHAFVRTAWFTKKYIHNLINEHFDLRSGHTLDFGAGTGANCVICNPDSYIGIEPDVKRIEYAKKRYPDHRFIEFDSKRIAVPDRSIDTILIVAVLHHIPDNLIREYLLEFARILKPAGKIVVIEPYLCNRTRFNNRFMNWYDEGEHIRYEEDYLNLFRDAEYDFQVLKRFTKCFVYNELFFSAAPRPKPLPAEHPINV